MKKHSPSYEQNGQLVHWFTLAPLMASPNLKPVTVKIENVPEKFPYEIISVIG
jgi:hypothetical protein